MILLALQHQSIQSQKSANIFILWDRYLTKDVLTHYPAQSYYKN